MFFPPAAFKIFFFVFVFSSVIWICLKTGLFGFILFGIFHCLGYSKSSYEQAVDPE